MADTITTASELKFVWLFQDGDDRTQTLKNPIEQITASQIADIEEFILNGGSSTLLIGDKTGAAFRRINSVTRVKTITQTLDLSED